MLDAAFEYAARGWPVFPLRPAAKVPATKRGLHAATTDADTLTAWWEHQPDMNIGVACGPASLLVVDLDRKADVNGLEVWWDLVAGSGEPFTATYTVCTPSAGLHLYYALEPGWMLGNTAGKLGPGIDTRAAGGYVVAPPSTTPAGRYEADEYWDEVQPAPPWLIDRLKPAPARHLPAPTLTGDNTAYGSAALDQELTTLAGAVEGTRNDALVRASFRMGRLVGGGQLDAAHATGQLLIVALRIGLSEREAVRTVRSGLQAGLASPRTPR